MPIVPERRTTKTSRSRAALNRFRGTANLFGGGKIGGISSKWKIKVHGQRRLKTKFNKVKSGVSINLYDVMTKSVLLVEADAKYLIVHGYYRPAVDTGRLLGSVSGEVVKYKRTYIEGKVGTPVYYSFYVHEGTWFMARRRFLTDALARNRGKITGMIKKALRNTIKKV